MTAHAPLAAAIDEAREVLSGRPVSLWNPRNPRVAAEDALRSILAALDADDRLERAEAALREIERMCANGYYPPDNAPYAVEAKRIASRYFAEKEARYASAG